MAKAEHEMMFKLAAQMDSSVNSSFNSVQSEMNKLMEASAKLNQQQADISAYQKQASAVASTEASLQRYQTQLNNVQAALAKTADSSEMTSTQTVNLQNQEANLTYRVSEASRTLTEQQEKLNTMGTALENAGIDTNNLGEESQRLASELDDVRDQMDQVGENGDCFEPATSGAQAFGDVLTALGIAALLDKVTGAMKDCADAAMDFETAMASVRRTVGGSEEYIDDLASSFEAMSTTMPITAEELASVATTAGQLGIAQEDVEEFTEVMAMLGTTTDLTADEAATMLAQFSNITGVTEYDRLGSTVADLGDATATTATKVVEMSQGMAAAASVAGMSSTDILAISAAVGSLGIESQAGSTAMSTLISTLYKAVESGGDSLDQFASVANMSAEEFATAWEGDPVRALDAFIQGLNDTERNGESAIMVLDDLGITNVRQTKAILGLAEAGDLLSTTIDQANAAWEDNTALQEKADVMYDTTESHLTMMQNAFTNLKVAIGDSFLPVMESLYDVGTQALNWMTDFVSEHEGLVTGASAAAIAMTGLVGAITAFNAVSKAAKKFDIVGMMGGAETLVVLGAVAATIGVVTAAVTNYQDKVSAYKDASYEMTASTRAQKEELERLEAEYDALVDAGEGTSAEAQELRAHIEDLTDEYDNNAQSVTELISEMQALAGASDETQTAFREAIDAADEMQEGSSNLVDRLAALQEKESLTTSEEAEMASIVEILNDRYSDLGLTLDGLDLTDSTGGLITTQDIKNTVNATAAADKYEASIDKYSETLSNQPDLYEAMRQAAIDYAEQEKIVADLDEKRRADGHIDADLNEQYQAESQHLEELRENLQNCRDEYNENNELMQEAAGYINDYNQAQIEYAESTEGQIEAIHEAMDALQAEYDEYYDAALTNIQGTFSIWETAAEVVAVSVEDQIAAMQSQIDYWTEYEENVQLVTEALNQLDEDGYDTTNARAYFEELQSDPEESAAAMAGWAEAIDADSEAAQTSLMEAGDKFGELTEVQQSTADATTELAMDFADQMQDMQDAADAMEKQVESDMDSMVAGMDRSSDAWQAGLSTITNFATAVQSIDLYSIGLSQGQSYVSGLAAGSANAASYVPTVESFGYYASGTESAPPGWAWVGEEGPELMYLHGGEEIMSHSASEQLLAQLNAMEAKYDAEPLTLSGAAGSGDTIINNVSPVINISGVADAEELLDGNFMDQLTDRIMDSLDQAQKDAQRRSFS